MMVGLNINDNECDTLDFLAVKNLIQSIVDIECQWMNNDYFHAMLSKI